MKLAESREIELNNYVQLLLKLPIQISHSTLVLAFFQSQKSDPKPAAIFSIKPTKNQNSDSSLDYDDDGDDVDDDDLVDHNSSDENSHFEDSDFLNLNDNKTNQDDSDSSNTYFYEEYNAYANKPTTTTTNSSNNRLISGSAHSFATYATTSIDFNSSANYKKSFNNLNSTSFQTRSNNNLVINNSRKKSTDSSDASYKMAGLWWDEDIALNELTLSTKSFGDDFNHSQYNLNCNNYRLTNSCYYNKEEEDEVVVGEDEDENEDMRNLEAIIKNSELFSNLATKSKSNQSNKRFSLAYN